MKWIKASERQPPDWSNVTTRKIGDKTPLTFAFDTGHGLAFSYFSGESLAYVHDNLVEWLDESPEPVTIGIDGGPLYRPYFQIGNQTFYIDAHDPEDYNWYIDQMEAAFKKLPVEVKRID